MLYFISNENISYYLLNSHELFRELQQFFIHQLNIINLIIQ